MGLYLGIDASTQGIKAEIIDSDQGVIAGSYAVNFGKDLPEYAHPYGYLPNDDDLVRQADPLMWLDALDLLFDKMRQANAPLTQICGISGSGQQHGSVYLNERFADTLGKLDPGQSLAAQLKPCLSRPASPIWMDRSTREYCQKLDQKFGKALQQITGSPAIERFTGPQIMKFANEEPERYRETGYIHLVSSFLCSVLIGKSAPIDYGDGAGMNLLNLKTLQWDPEIAEFTAPGLVTKLPPPVPSSAIAGGVSPYFGRYGLKAGTPVAVWSGDNPNSLIGVGAGEPGVAVISLGTSDTFFAAMPDFKTDPDGFGHVFGNPQGGFMSLICFTNGSLAREKIKEMCKVSWEYFDRLSAEEAPPGNDGKLLLPYFTAECTPLVLAPKLRANFDLKTATAAEIIRACLESQALSMRLHSRWQAQNFKRIRITGGAAKSDFLRQILADVFQAEIESIQVGNSAGLGAALRAANAVSGIAFDQLYGQFCRTTEVIKPNSANAEVYQSMLRRYADFAANPGQ